MNLTRQIWENIHESCACYVLQNDAIGLVCFWAWWFAFNLIKTEIKNRWNVLIEFGGYFDEPAFPFLSQSFTVGRRDLPLRVKIHLVSHNHKRNGIESTKIQNLFSNFVLENLTKNQLTEWSWSLQTIVSKKRRTRGHSHECQWHVWNWECWIRPVQLYLQSQWCIPVLCVWGPWKR